jgi:hypothetical protein
MAVAGVLNPDGAISRTTQARTVSANGQFAGQRGKAGCPGGNGQGDGADGLAEQLPGWAGFFTVE